ncbi:MAG: glycosyltransferase family 2 protein [bacterium]
MISIIIVTWNSGEHLFSCLKSVKSQTEKDLELVIVDNNSSDSTKEIIKSFKTDIFIENSSNLGFARANNQGISVSKGDYILTLNPDVILGPHYLKKVREEIKKKEKTGMVSGMLIRPSGVIDSQGIYLSSSRRFYDIGEGRESGTHPGYELLGPCAAAGFYSRKMLDDIKIPLSPPFTKGEIGGFEYFDEDFFAYIEDVDLAWRANILGWKAAYCHDAVATHFRGGSRIDSQWKQYLSFRNRYLMIIKNEKVTHLMRYFYLFILYDLTRVIFLFFKNKYVTDDNLKFSNLLKKAWKKRKLILKKQFQL